MTRAHRWSLDVHQNHHWNSIVALRWIKPTARHLFGRTRAENCKYTTPTHMCKRGMSRKYANFYVIDVLMLNKCAHIFSKCLQFRRTYRSRTWPSWWRAMWMVDEIRVPVGKCWSRTYRRNYLPSCSVSQCDSTLLAYTCRRTLWSALPRSIFFKKIRPVWLESIRTPFRFPWYRLLFHLVRTESYILSADCWRESCTCRKECALRA